MLIGLPNASRYHNHGEYLTSADVSSLTYTLSQITDAGTAAAVDVGSTDGKIPLAEDVYARSFKSGTRATFNQSAAPTGWTKETNSTYNNIALRVVTGSVSGGGTDAFTTSFGSGKTTGNTSLSITQIPAHTHTYTRRTITSDQRAEARGDGYYTNNTDYTNTTGAAGSGQGHNHSLSLNLKYTDIIIAVKD